MCKSNARVMLPIRDVRLMITSMIIRLMISISRHTGMCQNDYFVENVLMLYLAL